MCYCPTPTLHLNLALTGDGAFLFSLKKTHSVWFISVLNYGDTENVLINHLLIVIPMSYPCHYTNLCPHKPHKHAHTHTHTHTHTTHTTHHTLFIAYVGVPHVNGRAFILHTVVVQQCVSGAVRLQQYSGIKVTAHCSLWTAGLLVKDWNAKEKAVERTFCQW